jgi:hypothetical protein
VVCAVMSLLVLKEKIHKGLLESYHGTSLPLAPHSLPSLCGSASVKIILH